MYRTLIVDDEPIAVQSIEYIITHNLPEVQIVGTARSGREAIEKAYSLRPDIILMDINMPGINGLEAMRQIRLANPEVRFIVASAFDYFDYAVEAVNLGVDEYILKPVREARLVEALQKVIEVIEKSRSRIRRELELKEKFEMVLPVLETGFISALCLFDDNAEELRHYCRLFDSEKMGGYVMAIEFSEKEGTSKISAGVKSQNQYESYRDILKSGCRCIVGPMMLNLLIVFVFDEREDDSFEQKASAARLAKSFCDRAAGLGSEIAIGIGRRCAGMDDAKRSYREALSALRYISKNEGGGYAILHADDRIDEQSGECADYEEQFEKGIYENAASGNARVALLAFEDIYARMCADLMPDFDLIKNNSIALIVGFGRRWGKAVKNYGAAINEIIGAQGEAQLKGICRRYIEEAANQLASGKQRKISSLIEKADRYLESNFGSEITLEEIAKEVNLSPYYFSRFYKEETGVNFIDKLTTIRVLKAKEYLQETDYSIKDVSRLVGYLDPNYFSKLFKKATGVTATEYKEQHGK